MDAAYLLKEAIHIPVSPPQGKLGPAGYAALDIALKTVASIHVWARLRLAPGETAADRLRALLVGIADQNQDGELDANEQGVLAIARSTAWLYLESKSVVPDDLDDILNRWDADRADAVRSFLPHVIPAGKLAVLDIDRFVFGLDPEAVLDTKRIVGKVPPVRITAGQKAAILEARRLATAVVNRRALEVKAWRDRQRARMASR